MQLTSCATTVAALFIFRDFVYQQWYTDRTRPVVFFTSLVTSEEKPLFSFRS